MKYSLEFHKDITEDYDNAYAWYEAQKPGLGERFLSAVNKKLKEVSEQPHTFGERVKKGYREAKVDIFPYHIVFRIYRRQRIIFIATIHHEKKHPRKKYKK